MKSPLVRNDLPLKWLGIITAIIITAGLAVALQLNERTVNDPDTLAYLWDEYIQDTIGTIANQSFSKPEEIRRDNAIRYAVNVIIRKGAYQKLSGGSGRVDPQVVSQYIQQYLNIEINDVVPQKDFVFGSYDAENDVLDVREMTNPASNYNYYENPWGFMLHVTTNITGDRYTVKLVKSSSGINKRVLEEKTCVLQKRPDGTMYFKSIRYNFNPPSRYSFGILGKYQKLNPEKLNIDSDNKQWPLVVLANYDGKVFARSGNEKELRVYDSQNFNQLTSLASSTQFLKVKRADYGYLVVCRGSLLRLDHNLNVIEQIDIPLHVTREAINDNWWGGFDISRDGRYFVYSSQSRGLFLYDVETGAEKLLARHLPENKKFEFIPYLQDPTFVDGDSKIVARINGYECIGGYEIIDLKTGAAKTLSVNDFGYNCINAFDSDLPSTYGVFTYYFSFNHDSDKNDVYVARLDYQKMELTQHKVMITDENQREPVMPEFIPWIKHNSQYLAYVSVQSGKICDSADVVYHIVRIDLDTLEAETILSIDTAEPNILGMLEDGRVIFSYYFEDVSGLGVTLS